jgi:hypothetical protein
LLPLKLKLANELLVQQKKLPKLLRYSKSVADSTKAMVEADRAVKNGLD